MDYVSKIFERTNLRHIRAFVMYGEDCVEVNGESYAERLKSAEKNIYNNIVKLIPDQSERDDFTNKIFAYTAEVEDIYAEIGIQCGAMISIQLLSELLCR